MRNNRRKQDKQDRRKDHRKFELSEMELITQHIIMPENLNPNYHVFGGALLAWLDKDIYIYTATQLKHSLFVTGSMNDVRFRKPAYLGEILQLYGKIREVRTSSVVTSGIAVAFNPETGVKRKVIECEIIYISVNTQGKVFRLRKQS